MNGNYTIHEDQGGTVQMRVMCQEDGYVVDISACEDERWVTGAGWKSADRIEVKALLGYGGPSEEDIEPTQAPPNIRKRRMQIGP